MEKPKASATDTSKGCEVWTADDSAEDVAAHLRTANLCVSAPRVGPKPEWRIYTVSDVGGEVLLASTIMPFLKQNVDWEAVDFSYFKQ